MPLNFVGNNFKMDNRKKAYEVVDWIRLAVDKNRWQTRVNGSIKSVEFSCEVLLHVEEGLGYVESVRHIA
jgi:hypothetical protein